MDLEKLHEEEVVCLQSAWPRQMDELREVLRSHGFTFHDDVWSLDRKDFVPAWQHGSIVEVDILRDGGEVYPDEAEWDMIRLRYLFASLPVNCIPSFCDVVWKLANSLKLTASLQGEALDHGTLRSHFWHCSEDLSKEFGESPGSESLAIIIQTTYPRRCG